MTLAINTSHANESSIDSISDKLIKTAQDRFGSDTDLHIQVTDFVESAGTYYVSSGPGAGVLSASVVPTEKNPRFTSILLPCSQVQKKVCIEEVSYRSLIESKWKSAVLQTSYSLSRTGQVALTYPDGSNHFYGNVTEDLKNNRPAGGNASIWRMEGAEHKGGNEYFLSASISNFPRGYTQDPLDLSVKLQPIKVTTPGDVRQYQFPNNVRQYQFPENFEFRVVLRLESLMTKLSKWYSARLASPEIIISGENLEVIGRPVKVPLARTLDRPCKQISTEQRAALSDSFQLQGFANSCETSGSVVGADANYLDNGKSAFQIFQLFESELYEIGKNSHWSFDANYELGECNSSDITGFVSSNAMIFTPNPPTFNKSDRTLVYQMASPHLDRSGKVNVGNLDIFLKKTVAQCLWKMESIDLYQSAISVIYANGESVLGTTTVNSAGEWIRINVSNFTFSSPTVKLSFVPISKVEASDKPKTPVQVTVPDPVKSALPEASVENPPASDISAKKRTITCIKGKITRKVTGTNPKCPKGFKKR